MAMGAKIPVTYEIFDLQDEVFLIVETLYELDVVCILMFGKSVRHYN